MRFPHVSRRRFLQGAAVAVVGGVGTAARRTRAYGANERLRVASIGVSGRGWADHTAISASPQVDIVVLCDVDLGPEHMGRAAKRYPEARQLSDWRRLLDRPDGFDAVIVSTPDHMHTPIALAAMQLGKHVFCQKPLTHTVHEARQMRRAAEKYGVVTQMCNQGQSSAAYRTAVKLVQDGTIGKVKEVHSWQSGPMRWLLVDERPPGADPVPEGLQWDDWLGVAAPRPYKREIYHPNRWRAWQEFSNGQLGDFGCHILDPVVMALGLAAPVSIRAEAPPLPREVWTKWCRIHYEFAGTERTAGDVLKLTWNDGEGHYPPREALRLPEGLKLPGAGSVLVGEKGSVLVPHIAPPRLFPEEKFAGFAIETVPAVDHFVTWADACHGVGRTTSPFTYGGPLTETVLLGSIALRMPGETLRWDAAALRFTNASTANELLRKSYRKGWEPAWVS
jgi:predicted dehydrogenase